MEERQKGGFGRIRCRRDSYRIDTEMEFLDLHLTVKAIKLGLETMRGRGKMSTEREADKNLKHGCMSLVNLGVTGHTRPAYVHSYTQ